MGELMVTGAIEKLAPACLDQNPAILQESMSYTTVNKHLSAVRRVVRVLAAGAGIRASWITDDLVS
jgi:hypothetical protein